MKIKIKLPLIVRFRMIFDAIKGYVWVYKDPLEMMFEGMDELNEFLGGLNAKYIHKKSATKKVSKANKTKEKKIRSSKAGGKVGCSSLKDLPTDWAL